LCQTRTSTDLDLSEGEKTGTPHAHVCGGPRPTPYVFFFFLSLSSSSSRCDRFRHRSGRRCIVATIDRHIQTIPRFSLSMAAFFSHADAPHPQS
jgi:hypothetical protein